MLSTVSELFLEFSRAHLKPFALFKPPWVCAVSCQLSYCNGIDIIRARIICTTMSSGGGYWDGGVYTDIDAEGGWMLMGLRV